MSYSKSRIVHNQSSSLWNYTLSPGWTKDEVEILKLALMKFGIGRWRKIINSQCLPGKSIGQIYMQTQRLLGQQSLGEFMGIYSNNYNFHSGLSVNLEKIFLKNKAKKDVFRKNNSIINTGDNMTQDDRKKKIQENKRQYGIPNSAITNIRLPRYKVSSSSSFLTLDEVENGKFTIIEKLQHLCNLEKDIIKKIEKIDRGELKDGEELWFNKPITINLKKENGKFVLDQ